jgi:hydroxyacylglutathione hydrolase
LNYCGLAIAKASSQRDFTVLAGHRCIERGRAAEAANEVAKGRPTIPTMIGEEKRANPFLRADIPEVAAGIGMGGRPAVEVFAEIRERKNRYPSP